MSEAVAPPVARRDTGVLYLALILVAPVVYEIVLTMSGDRTVLGWAPATLALLVVILAGIAAWLPYRPAASWSCGMTAWLLALVVLWLWMVVSGVVVDGDLNVLAVTVPVAAVLILIKRPSRTDVLTAADALGIAVIVTGVLALVLEAMGAIPSWYEVLGGRFLDLASWDRDYRWLPVNEALGLDGRWGGPLRDPNLIGPVSAVLAVYGFRRPGWRGAVIAVGGLLFALLADSRAAYGALVIGLLAAAVLPGWTRRGLSIPRILTLGAAALVTLRILRDYSADPLGSVGMSGRTGMWPSFLSLLDQSPWTGVGSSGIAEAVATGVLPEWSYHGHNQFIDTVVRYGWVGLALTVLVVAGVGLLALVAAWNRDGLPLAMLLAFVVGCLANLLLDWRYPSVPLSVLVTIALLAGTVPSRGAVATASLDADPDAESAAR